MEKEIESFPKIWSLGSKEAANIFKGTVEVTEKIDGSQFSFGKTKEGKLVMRSKGQQIFTENVPDMFKPVVDYVLSIQDKIGLGWFYYGETLKTPKHNTLAYARIPKNHLALFGCLGEDGKYDSQYNSIASMANYLKVDVVPIFFHGEIKDKEQLDKFLELDSYLGNVKIEGVVIKNYSQMAVSAFSQECFVKLVREEFKERNAENWPSRTDKIEAFLEQFRTEARWQKAVQHLRDSGQLEESPRDIGKLLKEVQTDLLTEEQVFIKDKLYQMFKDQIARVSVRGLPEWYKEKVSVNPFAAQEA